jgi:hypothetical protein
MACLVSTLLGGILADNRPWRRCQKDRPALGILYGKRANAVSGDLGVSTWIVNIYINDLGLSSKRGEKSLCLYLFAQPNPREAIRSTFFAGTQTATFLLSRARAARKRRRGGKLS